MTRVDSHLHVNYRGMGPKKLVEYMDKRRIDRCWLLTWEERRTANPGYQHLSVDGVMEAYSMYPGRIAPFFAPDPASGDAAGRFTAYAGKGVLGCGELKVSLKWGSPELTPLLKLIDGMGLPLVFHMEEAGDIYAALGGSRADVLMARALNSPRFLGLPRAAVNAAAALCPPLAKKRDGMARRFPGYLPDFSGLEARLKEFPNIKFVAHGPLFWKGISAFMDKKRTMPRGPVVRGGISCRLLEEHDNLYADISAHSGFNALKRDPAFARKFILMFSRKLLYGTDNFFIGQAEFLDSLGLPRGVRDRIYGKNAESLLPAGGAAIRRAA